MNRIHSLFSFALASIALGSVACAAPQAGDDASSSDAPQALDLAAPAPEPTVLTCVTSLGSHEVADQASCEKLLTSAGCKKPGAVVGDKQKCSTATTEPPTQTDYDLAAPRPEPVLLTCVTRLGTYDVGGQSQCEKLLAAAGCTNPGAVVGNKQKCSTASTDPTGAPGGPEDLAAAPRGPSVLTCVTSLGTYQVGGQAQCEQLLTAAGCAKPGAVVGDKQKCTTTP